MVILQAHILNAINNPGNKIIGSCVKYVIAFITVKGFNYSPIPHILWLIRKPVVGAGHA